MSRGAVVSMIAAAADGRFSAVRLVHGGHFDFFEDGHRAAACPANYIGRLASPLFFLNSDSDGDFLPDPAIRPMHRLAGPSVEIRWTTAGGHGAMDEEDRSVLAAWLAGEAERRRLVQPRSRSFAGAGRSMPGTAGLFGLAVLRCRVWRPEAGGQVREGFFYLPAVTPAPPNSSNRSFPMR